MQVYLPYDLYAAVKDRELSPSELLQDAVRAELRRPALLEETDRYLGELIDEVGAPSPAATAKATKLAQCSRRIAMSDRQSAPSAIATAR